MPDTYPDTCAVTGNGAGVLLHRMAETVEVDLAEALLTGRLDGETFCAARDSCSACPEAARCGAWIEAMPSATPATPHYCRNRSLMARLRG